MSEKKELLVALQVKSINLNKKELLLKLDFPFYLEGSNKMAESLLQKLIKQNLGPFEKVKIKGLTLKWEEEE